MWIFTPESFVSIVSDPSSSNDRSRLVARARFPGDLDRFLEGAAVIETPASDYRFRTFATRDEIAAALDAAAARINYANFKDSVVDSRRRAAYSRVWQLMSDAQWEAWRQAHRDSHEAP